MKRLIKKLLDILAQFVPVVKKYHVDWGYFGKVPLGLIIVNFIFQRLLRINSEVDIPVHFTSRVTGYKNIKLYQDSRTVSSFAISGGCYIQAINGIEIGRNFLFAPGVKIISSNHDVHDRSKSVDSRPIKIGDNVWIGANAVILPGVTIGNNCIIGAGSVVTKSFEEDNLVIAGNPAKIIKKIQ